ncbi:helix-turn-helix transcriptional regulator [Antrihabitans cavernicola]|uniref:Helix-turn-helix transcriptional regulator n=1 Tax=Antrihabitans cavernicola TaxID=2495913 RepID=A0A5A7SA05_9NOCA|nr:helix-turn-helix transcriptional regulator [Spelaeibacter cavernicola]KAA0021667.1 helix-turn-helix transcriptional regulator [Spelaeibacter cavernicola]
MDVDTAGDRLDTLADRIRALFVNTRDQNGKPWTGRAVVAQAKALGYTLSEASLSELRSARVTNPSKKTLEALAAVFEVDTSYFANTAPDAQQRRALLDQRYRAVADRIGLSNVEYRLGSTEDDAALRFLVEALETDYVDES